MRNDTSRSAGPLRGLPLDHVAIAVPSIDDALPAFEALTGHSGSPRERVDAQGVELCFVGDGPGKLELLEPLSSESPVGRFLEKRGPGLHHIAYRVTDIEAALRAGADESECARKAYSSPAR